MKEQEMCWCKDCKWYYNEHCFNGKSEWVTEPVDRYSSCKDCETEETATEKEIYKQALYKWGAEVQIAMVFEEMAELQKELCKDLRGKGIKSNIAEEIADVDIMLGQMKILYEVEELVK